MPPETLGGENMGIFNSFFNTLNSGKRCAQSKPWEYHINNDTPVEVIEPSIGRIVELRVTEQDDFAAKLYIDQLTLYAKCLESCGVQWQITDKTIRLTFPDGEIAENTRKIWRK